MTAVLPDTDDFSAVELTAEELRRAVAHALAYADVTCFSELAQQARERRFTSTRARRAWAAIGGLGAYA